MRTCIICCLLAATVHGQQLVGVTATPHQFSGELKWRRPPNPDLAARVELFIQNTSRANIKLTKGLPPKFDNQTGQQLLQSGDWAWHDTPTTWTADEVSLSQDELTVFLFNGKSKAWGLGTAHTVSWPTENGFSEHMSFEIFAAEAWLSSVTFLSSESAGGDSPSVFPNQIVVHVTNDGDRTLRLRSLQVWLPQSGGAHHVFQKSTRFDSDELDCFPADRAIPAGSKGGFVVNCEPLPLTYAVVEVRVQFDGRPEESLWAHLRIKREVFDISGGWVSSTINGRNSLTIDEYRRTLKRMHVNTAQIQEVVGFTDDPQLYAELPLKRFNRLQHLSHYDTDEMLPTIHAVEFQGEPQYGGGRPVEPQEVWKKFQPYRTSRLPTSLTLSEERTWRYYAGLSDYPHFDAYRVTAPAADSWRSYDRWDGDRIRWGAPLETIGVMTRSLREQSRPKPIAYWSQGPHAGWRVFRRLRRASPTPDELRSQAWHGLANRVTSLYWFNLSLKSLAKFPDLIEPITRVNREIRMLDEIFLRGDAFEYRRILRDSQPDWELCSIASPETVMLIVHDLAYRAGKESHEFEFQAREVPALKFKLPAWIKSPLAAFEVNSDGTRDVDYSVFDDSLTLQSAENIKVVGIYLVTKNAALREKLDAKRRALVREEDATGFDPGNDAADQERLVSLVSLGE